MSNIEVRVIEDSENDMSDARLTTIQACYPRFIHAELMTHRVFSRNASSSRAIPIAKVIKQVWNDPAMPVHWGKNQPGMQADGELSGWRKTAVRGLWKFAAKAACIIAYGMSKLGAHKQVANRILEPFQMIHVIVTATEWDNFFELRDHPDAQPEIRELAKKIRSAMRNSRPKTLDAGQWHLPYVLADERASLPINLLRKLSAARCARVSYLTHDGKAPDRAKDVSLFEKLVGSRPLHASPVEHQATPNAGEWSGNFYGWTQFRKLIESGIVHI